MKTHRLLLSFMLAMFSMTLLAQSPGTLPDFQELFNAIDLNNDGRKKTEGTTTQSGDNSGGAEIRTEIKINWPSSGTMLRKDCEITWKDKPEMTGPYKVEIIKRISRDKSALYSGIFNGNTAVVPLGSLALDDRTRYSIQVMTLGENPRKSKRASFVVADTKVFNDAMQSLKASDKFRDESLVNQLLMKAFVLEKNNLFYYAAPIYNKFMSTDKDNDLMRNMRDRFMKEVKLEM